MTKNFSHPFFVVVSVTSDAPLCSRHLHHKRFGLNFTPLGIVESRKNITFATFYATLENEKGYSRINNTAKSSDIIHCG